MFALGIAKDTLPKGNVKAIILLFILYLDHAGSSGVDPWITAGESSRIGRLVCTIGHTARPPMAGSGL